MTLPHYRRILITGMNGTVAPALAAEIRARGAQVIAWDRSAVPPNDDSAVEEHIRSSKASALVHCAMGDPHWAGHMADCCRRMGIAFVYTGSVSVFGPHQEGPHHLDVVPEPHDDYGRYKLECEQQVLAAFPDAHVIRLGWQIALRPSGNQMVEYLIRRQAEHGAVGASTCWFPACSFLDDTARALTDALEGLPAGLYHLDGNPGWSMHRIACALNRAMGSPWFVQPTEDLRLNTMVRDERMPSVSIAARLRGG